MWPEGVENVLLKMWHSEGEQTCADIWSDSLDCPGLTAILKSVTGSKCSGVKEKRPQLKSERSGWCSLSLYTVLYRLSVNFLHFLPSPGGLRRHSRRAGGSLPWLRFSKQSHHFMWQIHGASQRVRELALFSTVSGWRESVQRWSLD